MTRSHHAADAHRGTFHVLSAMRIAPDSESAPERQRPLRPRAVPALARVLPSVLVVTDKASMLQRLPLALSRETRTVHKVESADDCLLHLRRTDVSLLILDFFMHRDDGLRLFRRCRKLRPSLPVIVLTQYPPGIQKAILCPPADNPKACAFAMPFHSAVRRIMSRLEELCRSMARAEPSHATSATRLEGA
jgi:DNA-binding NtrC family response regulator